MATGAKPAHPARHGVLVCVSGHGLLDLAAYDKLLAGLPEDRPADADALRAATASLRAVHPT